LQAEGVDEIRSRKKNSAEHIYTSDHEDDKKEMKTDRSEEMNTDRPLIQNTHDKRRDGVYENSR
jgi:hypothetical protein